MQCREMTNEKQTVFTKRLASSNFSITFSKFKAFIFTFSGTTSMLVME